MSHQSMRILLTGASGGMGEAFSLALTQAGARVLLVGRDPQKLSTLVDRLGPRAEACAADLMSAAERRRLAECARAWNCNVVIHGAGEAAFGAFDNVPDDAIDRVIGTNLIAPLHLSRLLFEHLAAQDAARIIFIGSALGRIGLPGYALYGASKAGVYGMAEALRREWAGSGVKVQYLGPRATRTPFNSVAAERYAAATGSRSDSPERVARALVRMLGGNCAVRHLGWPERLFVRLNALLGAGLDRGFARHAAQLRLIDPSHFRQNKY